MDLEKQSNLVKLGFEKAGENKKRIPLDNHGTSRKMRFGGSVLFVWGGGVVFIVNVRKRITRKFRRIIMSRFGLVTFRIHFRRSRKPVNFMVDGVCG